MLHQVESTSEIDIAHGSDATAPAAYGGGGVSCGAITVPALTHITPHGTVETVALTSGALTVDMAVSTIGTQLNLGASYMTNDLYRRFIRPHANESHYVTVSRVEIATTRSLAGPT